MLKWNCTTSGEYEAAIEVAQTTTDETVDSSRNLDEISNDEFLTGIFGSSFDDARPLICAKAGDPSSGGWTPSFWPTNTSDVELNWYFCPSIYSPDENNRPRAKSELAKAIACFMLDDIGTKVSLDVIEKFAPSWLIETSPGNFQAGYIFEEQIENLDLVERFKKTLIDNNLCDAGASGAAARWMRLPKGVNGKPKHGDKPFRCRLRVWNPMSRVTPEMIIKAFAFEIQNEETQLGDSPVEVVNHGERTKSPSDSQPILKALVTKGLYKQEIEPGKHEITCPWVSEHSDQTDSGAAYFEPSEKYPYGGFKCFHSHGGRLRITQLLNFLDIKKQDVSTRSQIVVVPGDMVRVADEAEFALSRLENLYVFAGGLATVFLEEKTGDASIKLLNKQACTLKMAASAEWFKATTDGLIPIDPPGKYVNLIFEKMEYFHIAKLKGISRQPYFYGDSFFSTKAGYDEKSELYGAFDPLQFNSLTSPTRDDAEHALQEIRKLLVEFSFQSEEDESAALAAILTASIRSSLTAAPMVHVRAPQIASGKSYLCNVIAAFAGPTKPSAIAFPESQEECQKLLLATLLESPASLIFDNLTGDLIPHNSLCSALTEEYIQGRILGQTAVARVGTRTMFLSSGNNVGPVRDMTRRTLVVVLDPKIEMASNRQFKFDPLTEIRLNRGTYVSHALTIINAWIQASRPMSTCRPIVSFERWTENVRQPLMWLNMKDPATRIFSSQVNDPDKEALERVLQAWSWCFGSVATMVREAVEYAQSDRAGAADLKESLEEVAERQGKINRRKLGHWISKNESRVVAGLRFERANSGGNSERWSARRLSSDQSLLPVLSVVSEAEKNDEEIQF